MSNYKLIEVVKTAERETQSIYDKDDLAKAISDMHNDFGVAVKTDATLSVYCTLIDQETGEKVETPEFDKEIIEELYNNKIMPSWEDYKKENGYRE